MFCSNCGKEISSNNKFCTFCGKEISSSKNFCAFCGSKIENINTNIQENNDKSDIKNSKMVKVTVIRKRILSKRGEYVGFVFLADPPMKIIIDGNQIANLKAYEFVDINLPVGQHKLTLQRMGISSEQTVDILPEFNRVTITVAWTKDVLFASGKIISIQTE